MLPLPPLPEPVPELHLSSTLTGEQLVIAGRPARSPWRWHGRHPAQPDQLWLPLDLLESHLGFRRVQGQLRWFGRRKQLADVHQISLGDEVALEVADWLLEVGVNLHRNGPVLEISLPTAQLQRLRRGKGDTAQRVVLDLDAPLLVQRRGDDLVLDLRINPAQLSNLRQLGLQPQLRPRGVALRNQATRLSTLSLTEPWRLVLDGLQHEGSATTTVQTLHSPAVASWQRRGLVLEQRRVKVGVKPLEMVRTGGDLATIGLALRPLTMPNRQTGLRFLNQIAQPAKAVVAVNGGFFNRILEVPLGALRRNNRWLSGPILNRGVVAWNNGSTLHFGRLQLQQSLWASSGQRHRLGHLNSGYMQRGLSRYTRAWGPIYRPLSGHEQAMVIRDGIVQKHFEHRQLKQGVVIPEHADLVVARGGIPLPAQPGERVRISSGSSSGLDQLQNVVGGGPLLMHNGRIVLNGRAEGFSPDFLALQAPRTVLGYGRGGTWLMTLRSASGSGPTLLETALLAKQLGLRNALNLDGGSSTTLVAGGRTVISGRGGTPRVHNGIGLVPLEATVSMGGNTEGSHGRQPPPHTSSRR